MNGYGNGRIRRADVYRRQQSESEREEEQPRYNEPDEASAYEEELSYKEPHLKDAPCEEEFCEEGSYEEEPFEEKPSEEDSFPDELTEETPVIQERDFAGDPLEEAQQLATNRTVILTCTLAAMMSPFAVFLLWAEKRSRAIRHNSLQSLALGIAHIVMAAVCFTPMALVGRMPLVGFVVTLCGWLLYFSTLVWVISVRLKLMRHAWLGLRYDIPLIGGWLERFI